MIKELIKYEDYNGDMREETAYFALSRAELTEMELSMEDGLAAYYTRIVEANNVPELSKVFKELIIKSYGIKSDDGKRFIKRAPDGHLLANDFVDSAAYEQFYIDLLTDTDKAIAFFNGIVPKVNKTVPAPEAK